MNPWAIPYCLVVTAGCLAVLVLIVKDIGSAARRRRRYIRRPR